jgi:pyruvyltransferase
MPDKIFLKNLLKRNIQTVLSHDSICAIWSPTRNWGDAISPILIEFISGKKPILFDKYTLNPMNRPVYTTTGSILDNDHVNRHIKNVNIWRIGFISKKERLRKKPKSIASVRGPLTREILLNQDIECPEVYGDPALLFPLFYKPEKEKRFKLGIVPHYVDKNNNIIDQFEDDSDVLIIDIEAPIQAVVDQICTCENIASSSLHGVIASDAYGVPSIWIEISNEVFGDGFKFKDYFQSVGREDMKPFKVSEDVSLDDLLDTFYNYRIDIDLKTLLDSCPFTDETIMIKSM